MRSNRTLRNTLASRITSENGYPKITRKLCLTYLLVSYQSVLPSTELGNACMAIEPPSQIRAISILSSTIVDIQ